MLQRFRIFSSSLLVVVASALVAACGRVDDGGGSGAGAAGTDGKAAEAIPADSLFFTSASNIDSGSDAWKQLNEVGSAASPAGRRSQASSTPS